MTLKVYGRKSSCNVQKVIWLCSEINIDFETLDYGGRYGGTKEQSFKNLNPNSTVPLIDDDGFSKETIAYHLGGDTWEYPFWVMLKAKFGSKHPYFFHLDYFY